MASYSYPTFDYVTPPELSGRVRQHPVAIVGAGPVGLTAAVDLARRGVPTVVLDDDDTVSVGSRAICWAKRTLEVFDRLGIAERMVDKGITWKIGRVFHRDSEIYQFDLLPEEGHKLPAFVNLQQYYVEQFLVEAAQGEPLIDLRFRNKVTDLKTDGETVTLTVETPDGAYPLDARTVLACDGARSPTRKMLGLGFEGKVFEDRFLIADVRMKAAFPTERWFWFNPPFHSGDSCLLHRQADDVFRIDLQLGWDCDPEAEKQPERVIPRLKAMLGEETPFELEWVSVYTFQCRRLAQFRHGRVFFVGDSAHQVSPFGARGGNGGVQDVDALTWKMALVHHGLAPDSLLDTYDDERVPACDENILNSTRSTDFLTPKSQASADFREAVLALAPHHDFARRLVNSGRLSLPHHYRQTPLSSPDPEDAMGGVAPGSPCPDAPVTVDGRPGWLLNTLGQGFTVLSFGTAAPLPDTDLPVTNLVVGGPGGIGDPDGLIAARYAPNGPLVYLIRPDHHVAARLRHPGPGDLARVLDRAAGRQAPQSTRATGTEG